MPVRPCPSMQCTATAWPAAPHRQLAPARRDGGVPTAAHPPCPMLLSITPWSYSCCPHGVTHWCNLSLGATSSSLQCHPPQCHPGVACPPPYLAAGIGLLNQLQEALDLLRRWGGEVGHAEPVEPDGGAAAMVWGRPLRQRHQVPHTLGQQEPVVPRLPRHGQPRQPPLCYPREVGGLGRPHRLGGPAPWGCAATFPGDRAALGTPAGPNPWETLQGPLDPPSSGPPEDRGQDPLVRTPGQPWHPRFRPHGTPSTTPW